MNTNLLWASVEHLLTVLDHVGAMLWPQRELSHTSKIENQHWFHTVYAHYYYTYTLNLTLPCVSTNGHTSGKETLLHTSLRSPPAALQRISLCYSETLCCCHGPQWMSGSD